MRYIASISPSIRHRRDIGRSEFVRPHQEIGRFGFYTSRKDARRSIERTRDQIRRRRSYDLLPRGYCYELQDTTTTYQHPPPSYQRRSVQLSEQYVRGHCCSDPNTDTKRISYRTFSRYHKAPTLTPHNTRDIHIRGSRSDNPGRSGSYTSREAMPLAPIYQRRPDPNARSSSIQEVPEYVARGTRARPTSLTDIEDDELARAMKESSIQLEVDEDKRKSQAAPRASSTSVNVRLSQPSPRSRDLVPPSPHAEIVTDSDSIVPSTPRPHRALRVIPSGPSSRPRSSTPSSSPSRSPRRVRFADASSPSNPTSLQVGSQEPRNPEKHASYVKGLERRIDRIVFNRFPRADRIKISPFHWGNNGIHDLELTVMMGDRRIWRVEAKDVHNNVDGLIDLLGKLEAGE